MVAGDGLQRRRTGVLRSSDSNGVGLLIDLWSDVGDELGRILDAVREHYQRLYVVRVRGGIENPARVVDAVADGCGALRIESIAVNDVLGRVAIQVRQPARAEFQHWLQHLRSLVERDQPHAIALQHDVHENAGRLLQRGMPGLAIAAVLGHAAGTVQRESGGSGLARYRIAQDGDVPFIGSALLLNRDLLGRQHVANGAGAIDYPKTRVNDAVGRGRPHCDRGVEGHQLRMHRRATRSVFQGHRAGWRHNFKRDRKGHFAHHSHWALRNVLKVQKRSQQGNGWYGATLCLDFLVTLRDHEAQHVPVVNHVRAACHAATGIARPTFRCAAPYHAVGTRYRPPMSVTTTPALPEIILPRQRHDQRYVSRRKPRFQPERFGIVGSVDDGTYGDTYGLTGISLPQSPGFDAGVECAADAGLQSSPVQTVRTDVGFGRRWSAPVVGVIVVIPTLHMGILDDGQPVIQRAGIVYWRHVLATASGRFQTGEDGVPQRVAGHRIGPGHGPGRDVDDPACIASALQDGIDVLGV